MGNLERLVGSPWHVEKMTREEGDDRRHRSRCVHYRGKPEGHCDFYCGKCRGAAHCEKYAEKHFENYEVAQMANNSAKQSITCAKFEGVKNIPLSLVVLDEKFRGTDPKDGKVQELKKYVKENGKLDKPIAVSCEGSSYRLKDKYLRYYVAKELGLKEIPAETGTRDELDCYDKLRTLGTLVWIKKTAEVGEVISFSLEQTRLRLDSGQEKLFDIHRGLKSEAIRIL